MRKLMWFALGFTLACAIAAYGNVPWLMEAAVVVTALSLFVLVLTHWISKLRFFCAIILGVSLGLGCFCVHDTLFLQTAKNMDGREATATIEVRDYSEKTELGCVFDGQILLEGKLFRVRTYLNAYEKLEPGHRVRGEFRFRYTTDKYSYLQSDGTFLLAYGEDDIVPQRYYLPNWYVYHSIWRQELRHSFDRHFPEETAGFAKALLLGDRSGIDYETNTAFKESGISHVIAVSGLHVSILFGLIYLITARKRLLTALIGIPVVLIFAAIAGFSPSITRASIMQILMMLALLWDREYDPLTALGASALIMELVNPLVVTSVSFQLSMGCMLGIFLFSQRIRLWLMDKPRLGRWNNRLTRWFSGSVSVTVSAMVFTTPLVAYYFGTVSLVGILTNLLTLWVITFVFYGIMAVCLLSFLWGWGATALAWVVSVPIYFVLWITRLLSRLPMAAVYTKSEYILLWLVGIYGLLTVFLAMKQKRPMLFAGLVLSGLALAVGASWLEPVLWECHVTVLDVGQGQSVILHSEGKTYLVDCGGDYDQGAADMAAETLLSRGISRIDGLIVTHLDRDHAGGVEMLLSRIQTDALYLPRVVDENGTGEQLAAMVSNTKVIGEDVSLTFGDTKLTIFAPVSPNSGNESSMCILFQTENCDILIPGDRGAAAEKLLMEDYELPKLEVLVVGHHGSKYSATEALLAQTRPEYALISVGADNSYGHPAKETLSRLLEFGCTIFTTADCGSIVFRR